MKNLSLTLFAITLLLELATAQNKPEREAGRREVTCTDYW